MTIERNIKEAFKNSNEIRPEAKPGDYVGEDGLLHCGTCHDAKEFRGIVLGQPFHTCCTCSCEMAEWEKGQERLKQAKIIKALPAIPSSIILSGTEGCNFEVADKIIGEEFTKSAKKYAESFSTMKATGHGLLIFGPPSCGKSLLAFAIANQVQHFGHTVLITSMNRALNELCDVRGGNRNRLIDDICSRSLLVIDDLGAERDSEFTREQALALVDARYRQRLPLIVTTNIGLAAMKAETDVTRKRIYDRILEVCRPMTLPARNLRIEAAASNQLQAKELLA